MLNLLLISINTSVPHMQLKDISLFHTAEYIYVEYYQSSRSRFITENLQFSYNFTPFNSINLTLLSVDYYITRKT
jgi:hypothetical protein